jgi:DNA-binding PadR family transcriptional regulator
MKEKKFKQGWGPIFGPPPFGDPDFDPDMDPDDMHPHPPGFFGPGMGPGMYPNPMHHGHKPPHPPRHHHRRPGRHQKRMPRPPWGPHPGAPPFPGREGFRQMKDLFILIIIIDNPDGINGYQLQEKYKIPRGSTIRSLEHFVAEGYVEFVEEVVDGREQKKYRIAEKGIHYIQELKENWANQFANMSEMAPPEQFGNPFLNGPHFHRLMQDLANITEKEDASDLFRGMRSQVKKYLKRMNARKSKIEETKNLLDTLIEKIDQMDALDIETIKKLIEDSQKE